jgi:hypothetical protein
LEDIFTASGIFVLPKSLGVTPNCVQRDGFGFGHSTNHRAPRSVRAVPALTKTRACTECRALPSPQVQVQGAKFLSGKFSPLCTAKDGCKPALRLKGDHLSIFIQIIFAITAIKTGL